MALSRYLVTAAEMTSLWFGGWGRYYSNVPSPEVRGEEQFEGQESQSASSSFFSSFQETFTAPPGTGGSKRQGNRGNHTHNPSTTVKCSIPYTHGNPSTRDKRSHLLQITRMVRRRRRRMKKSWLWRCTTSLALNHTTCVWSKEANTSSLRTAMSTGSRHATHMGNPQETHIQWPNTYTYDEWRQLEATQKCFVFFMFS